MVKKASEGVSIEVVIGIKHNAFTTIKTDIIANHKITAIFSPLSGEKGTSYFLRRL